MALEKLHGPHCRGLLALSEAARRFFFWQNDGLLSEEVRAKTSVFYGGVETHPALQEEHRRFLEQKNGDLVLCFIGHDFFRKGGRPLLDGFEAARRAGMPVKLQVISGVSANDYASGEDDAAREKAVSRLRANRDIVWHDSLPHGEVMKALANSHVAVLPTLDDTLGWSVLEAMSLGVPVIASNVFAMPEMVDDGTNGFLIPLPLAQNRRWTGIGMVKSSAEFRSVREEAYERIASGIVGHVSRFLAERELLQAMGQAAIRKVDERFSVEKQALQLRSIYEGCLAAG